MKSKLSILLFIIFIGVNAFAQGTDSWNELNDYHKVMASTFHPSEEGNLKPIKTRASELKEMAIALANSKIPAEFDNEKIKAALEKLQEQSMIVEKMVANNASDKELTAYLSTVHDTFHEIMGMCRGGDHEGHDHKEGEKHKE